MEYQGAIETLGQMHVQSTHPCTDYYDVMIYRGIGKCSVWKNDVYMGVHDMDQTIKMITLPDDISDVCSFMVSGGRPKAPQNIHLGKHLLKRIDSGQFYVSDGTKSIFIIASFVFQPDRCCPDGPLFIKEDDSLVRIADTDEITRLIDAMNMTNIRWGYDDDTNPWNSDDDDEVARLLK